MENKTIAVWFSCGAASAVAAKKTIEIYGEKNKILVVNSPILEEHPDNLRFLNDVESWLGQEIIIARSEKYPSQSIVEVFDKQKYMSGVLGAPCTKQLKKEARYLFEKNNNIDFHVLGFTVEEWKRQKKFNLHERNNTLPVLIQNLITKEDCFKILKKENIKLPEIYSLGYPNANCIGCVKSQSPTYWNLVRETFPSIFEERATQSRKIGCTLVKLKGNRIYLDELPTDAKGGKIKSWDCGVFCDIK